MRLQLLIVMVLLSFSSILAQTQPFSCPSDDIQNELLQDPAYFQKSQLQEIIYKKALKKAQLGLAEDNILTIPVAVHIMHGVGQPIGSDENIINARIEAEIQYLNDAFANVGVFSGNGYNINNQDLRKSVDIQIQFCLAQRDPNGNPTNGIDRIATNLTNLDADNQDVQLKNLSRWNPDKYINIWVVKEICTASGCSTAGYAYFPSSQGGNVDGIVVEAKHFGNSADNAKVLVHEMGHYFGLYHTFEGGCGNTDCTVNGDKICDTPPSDGSADQTTPSALNSSCTTDANSGPFTTDIDDLIEDYMAYSPQSVQNTYTANQKTRMRSSIEPVGSDRHIMLSSDGCDNTGSDIVYFKEDGLVIRESQGVDGPAAADCRKYIDYPIEIVRYNAASNSSINVSVASIDDNNAMAGVDYALMQTSASIGPGQSSATVILRVYNDDSPEPTNEGMTLTLSGANTGFNNTMKITIVNDDDFLPTPGRPIIYQTDFSTQGSWTFSSFSGGDYWSIGMNQNNENCGSGQSANAPNNGGWPVLFSPADATGYSDLQLEFDYIAEIAGQNAASILQRSPSGSGPFNTINIPSAAACSNYTYNFPASYDNTVFDFGFGWNNDGTSAHPFMVDNVKITAAPSPLASAISSVNSYLGPNATTVFYAADGSLIAQIENLTNFDYGCTTVEIDQAGTNGTLLSGGTSYFADKTIKITPSTNNENGVYRIKLFYTQAEVNGWMADANDVAANLKIMKTPTAMSNATSANTQAFETILDQWGNHSAFTAVINTGFSGFSIGNLAAGPLPLELVNFTATKAQSTVRLDWETLSEKEFSHFIVERSFDGISFEQIDRLASKNQNGLTPYTSFDTQPKEGVSYYRLKMVDLDGTFSYSKVVSIEFIRTGITNIYPNPVSSDEFAVSYSSDRNASIDLRIVNVLGQVLFQETYTVQKGENTIMVPASDLPEAMYNLILKNGTEQSSFRFWNL